MIGNNCILTEKRKTGCNPEIANLHKKRYVVFRELPLKTRFENSIVKELTGGGTICARGLYESETTKKLHMTCVVECNKKPLFSEEPQRAEMERIVDVLFKNTFTNKQEEVNEQNNVFIGNTQYKEEEFQNQHRCALLQILFEAHKRYVEDGRSLKLPKSIKDRTKQYMKMSSDI